MKEVLAIVEGPMIEPYDMPWCERLAEQLDGQIVASLIQNISTCACCSRHRLRRPVVVFDPIVEE